jgi:hypothetical protein
MESTGVYWIPLTSSAGDNRPYPGIS